jgi:hypothetical protein
MRRTAVGPYQIRKRNGRFEVMDGHAVLSRHETFFDAEEAALRAWLHKNAKLTAAMATRSIWAGGPSLIS